MLARLRLGPGRFARAVVLERNPAFGPGADLFQRVLELAPFWGKLVLNAHRAFGDDNPEQQIFSLERAKPLRQHPIGEIGNRGLDGAVAASSLEERLQDGAAPAATDQLDSPVKAGANL